MTLATKLTLALWAGILLVHSASATVRIDRQDRLFTRDTAHDGQVLGRALSHAVDRAWRAASEAEALAVLEHASTREHSMQIRWVWLDGDPSFRPPPELARLLGSKRTLDQTSATLEVGEGGEKAILTYTPLETPDGRLGAIEITDRLRAEKAYARDSVVVTVVSSAVLAGLCGLLAWALSSRFVERPIAVLVAHAERIGAGDLSPSEPLRGSDEIARLSLEMNGMCERLRESRDRAQSEVAAREAALEQLRHADRLRTVGTLASGIAHELGTPINVVEGHAQLARESARVSDDILSHLDVITRQCKRMAGIIRQLLDFSRTGSAQAARCQLVPVVRESVTLAKTLARKSQVGLDLSVEGEAEASPLEVPMADAALQQVLLNIMINALQASSSDARVEVAVATRREPHPESKVERQVGVVRVRDSGPGMDASTLTRIFEPFFTTKEVGIGTGLGLSVAYGIVREAGGYIQAESQPGSGSTLTVVLPVR